jgi:hypothetical protein
VQSQSGGAADAFGAAGYEGNFACEWLRHGVEGLGLDDFVKLGWFGL